MSTIILVIVYYTKTIFKSVTSIVIYSESDKMIGYFIWIKSLCQIFKKNPHFCEMNQCLINQWISVKTADCYHGNLITSQHFIDGDVLVDVFVLFICQIKLFVINKQCLDFRPPLSSCWLNMLVVVTL